MPLHLMASRKTTGAEAENGATNVAQNVAQNGAQNGAKTSGGAVGYPATGPTSGAVRGLAGAVEDLSEYTAVFVGQGLAPKDDLLLAGPLTDAVLKDVLSVTKVSHR